MLTNFKNHQMKKLDTNRAISKQPKFNKILIYTGKKTHLT